MSDLTVDDLPNEYDVAVVVIAKARGVDAGDAANRVEQAIGRTLRATEPLTLPHRGGDVEGATVDVYRVMDAGMALANGYLWAKPSAKARREVTDEPLAGD